MASSGAAASQHVVKAGWMQRMSDVLKRWKPTYCVLKTSGLLSYYHSESQTEAAQGHINLPRDTFGLKVGQDVVGVSPPPGMSVLSLIEVRTSQAATIFCAESPDDAQMWKLVFDDVIRANRAPRPTPAAQAPMMMAAPPPPYTPQVPGPVPGPVAGPAPPPAYVVAPPPPLAPAPSPVTVISPGTTSRITSTTYYPNGQSVTTVRREQPSIASSYPVQQTVYTYPGQTLITPGAGGTVTYQVPNQTQSTTTIYRYY